MRVLRFSLNPATPEAKCPDFGALQSGVMRWIQPGVVLEVTSDLHQPDTLETVRKSLRNGTLVPADEATARAAGVPWKSESKAQKSPKVEG